MKYFIVPMFPYPSGYFHMGHARNYIFSDIIKRFLDITQYNKFYHCLGIDAFGLPAENASIKYGIKPNEWTNRNVEHIINSLDNIDVEFNNNTWISTSDTNFIRLNQFIFQILFENKLIYRDNSYVNWDPEDKTVLSNEQIINYRGWRSGAIVQKRLMTSWYVRISEMAEFLKEELKKINWPTKIKKIQNSWIEKVNGFIIKFKILNSNDFIDCFTKKPECCFNAKFIAIAYTHKLAIEFIKNNNILINNKNINNLCIKMDLKCINYYNNEIIDVYIAGYVISNFATMALYGAPNLDEKDRLFAEKANISFSKICEETCNFEILNKLKQDNIIYPKSIYTLNDWCISRQRVWGCPIPIIYCEICGTKVLIDNSLNERRLSYKDFSSLKKEKLYTMCDKGHKSLLEVETLDTFFDSSWYYLCYLVDEKLPYIKNIAEAKEFLRTRLQKLPINIYVGGIEHSNLHLIYTRAIIAMLHKCLKTEYILPIETLITQGSVLHNAYLDKNKKYIDGKIAEDIFETKMEKMSKSKLNIVTIESIREKFTSDTIRFAIMSNMPIEISYEWDITIFYKKDKFLRKLIGILDGYNYNNNFISNNVEIRSYNLDEDLKQSIYIYVSEEIYNKYRKYINYMESYKIHNAIAVIHELFNYIKSATNIDEYLLTILFAIYPITPKLASKYLKNIFNINKSFTYEIRYRHNS